MTQRSKNWMWLKALNPRFSTWLKKLNLFSVWLEDLNFLLEMSQRIKPFWKKKKKRWLEELIFRKISIKIKKHFLMIQRINWTLFSEWLKDFVEYDSKNRTFFLWIWLQESTFFKKYVLRIVLKYDSQNWTYFSALPIEWNIWEYDSKELIFHCNKTWHKELNLFLIWPNRLNFFFCDMTPRIEFFWCDSKNRTLVECESKNWTFHQHDSKNWTLKFNLTQRIEPSSQKDSKNWTLKRLFQKMYYYCSLTHAEKKCSISMSQYFQKRVQFCESCFQKKVQFCESYSKKGQ